MSVRARRIRLDDLESFVAVAEAGSVTAAVRRLALSQPTVTQHLQRVEARVGRPLMARGTGGIALTPEGARLLPLARGLLRLEAQIAPRGRAPLPPP